MKATCIHTDVRSCRKVGKRKVYEGLCFYIDERYRAHKVAHAMEISVYGDGDGFCASFA